MLPNTVNNNIEYFTSTNNIFLEYKIASNNNDNIVFCTSLTKNFYDDCLYYSKAKDIIKLIKNRKIVFSQDSFLQNDINISEYYSFNQKLIFEYKKQAKNNIYFLINNVTITNNSLKTVLSCTTSHEKFLYVTQILLEYSEDYPLFMLENSATFMLEKLYKIKQGTISEKQLVALFDEIVSRLCIEESELLKMFYKAAKLSIDNNKKCVVDLLDFLAIALYWIVEITQRTKIPLRDKDCIFDPLILLTIHDLGYNPWLFFALDNIEFSQICKMNRLLTQCINIHFSRMQNVILAKIFIEKNNTTVNSYIYIFLARIMPLFLQNKNTANKLASIEILPQTLLLATYKIFPEIIATAILQKITDNKPEFIFDRNTLFIGEEFEFRDLQDKYFLLNTEYLVLESWIQKAKQEFNKKGITNYYFTNSLTCKAAISIGNWEYTLFKDGENLEINTTPYKNQDIFTIIQNNKEIQYTAYQVFDEFIHIKLQDTGFLFMKTTIFIVYF